MATSKKQAAAKPKVKEVAAPIQEPTSQASEMPTINDTPKPVTVQGKNVAIQQQHAGSKVYLTKVIAGKRKIIAGAIDMSIAKAVKESTPGIEIIQNPKDVEG